MSRNSIIGPAISLLLDLLPGESTVTFRRPPSLDGYSITFFNTGEKESVRITRVVSALALTSARYPDLVIEYHLQRIIADVESHKEKRYVDSKDGDTERE